MKDKLLKIIKLADELNEKQDKVYAEIEYVANDSKKTSYFNKVKKGFFIYRKM